MTPIGQQILLTILSLLIAGVVSAIPASRAWCHRRLDALRDPSPQARRITAAIIFVTSIAYMGLTAWDQGRELIPKFHDEHMHLLQMRMLAAGKLWTAPHPLADFFETFHVFVKPVYASIYFPGTALLYVPTVWLKLPYWFGPLIVAGTCCAMFYRILAETIDGVSGLLAALMLLSLRWFRYLSLMVMSHSVMLLLGLLILWAWLHWRQDKRLRWAIAIGVFAGWAAITRPVDALCYSIPVGLAMLLDLRRMKLADAGKTIVVIALCAIPFLSLQLIENKGVTGQWLKTPYRMYADLFTPQMSFGFHQFDPTIRPKTTLPQRQDYYDQFTVPAAKAHRPGTVLSTWLTIRLPLLADVDLPNRLLLFLFPLGLLGLTTPRHLVLCSVLPIYVAFYSCFAYLLPVYCIVIAPPVIAFVLCGKEFLQRIAGQQQVAMEVFLTVTISALCIAALPEIDREYLDDGFVTPSMDFSYIELPAHVKIPAIVLFRYHPGDNTNEEPIYNLDTINPDDSPIIRAHDLGLQRDRELIDYYARRQPDRTLYLYDRTARRLTTLGNVAELSKEIHAAQDKK